MTCVLIVFNKDNKDKSVDGGKKHLIETFSHKVKNDSFNSGHIKEI
jgi:hypothetical protein